PEALGPLRAAGDATPRPAVALPTWMAPVGAVHRFLSTPPADLDADRSDVFAFTTWSMLLALVTHLTYAVIFTWVQLTPLALFNVCSTALFVVCLHIARKGWTNTAMAVACVEVLAHAVLATLYVGFAAGFHYHALLVVVVTFLFTGVPLGVRMGSVLVTGATYTALALATTHAAPWAALPADVLLFFQALNVVVFITTTAGICWYYTLAVHSARSALRREFQRSEHLLHNVLPVSVADRLKGEPRTIAERYEACTVLFADMAGFTAWSATREPEELVDELNRIFSAFDAMAERHGVEKIKTIGDAYMVAAGVPVPREDHAEALARMALEMQAWVRRMRAEQGSGLAIRVGLHSGPVVAGVIGLRKFIYDLWGDTVNTAARMESHGITDEIQVSDDTAALLRERFTLVERGRQLIKGKGSMSTWLLVGERPRS
ncbi:MAG TPA: adenylate/guanylate cyclase domain-containing protein, partial [Myxococcota bacterium]|nr:adenylate/guanylate cyclase domain-containing protein [Myxococcota bacterium]